MSSRTEVLPPAQQAYPFLSQVPSHKKRSAQQNASSDPVSHTQPENVRRRSVAAISSWVSNVQPGPPAPQSPHKATFNDVSRLSKSARRHSIKPSPPSPVAYLPDSPASSTHTITPEMKADIKSELQAAGYTSVFVTLPRTPPAVFTPDGRVAVSHAPTTPPAATEHDTSRSAMRRFRSLSMKPPSRPKPAPQPKSTPAPTHAAVTKDKKSKYAEMRPAPLATELALAQFAGGGTFDHHVKQYSEKQAKKSGATKNANGQLVGVGDVWRDEEGRVWRDQEEEWEYTHLLGGAERNAGSAEVGWVEFDEERGIGEVDDRRGSVSTVDSDLDPRYAMTANIDPRGASVPAQHMLKAPDFNVNVFASNHHSRSKRRPEPINLDPPHSAYSLDAAQIRKDFLQSSFAPPAKLYANPTQSTVSVNTTSGSKRAGLRLKSLFKVGNKKSSRS